MSTYHATYPITSVHLGGAECAGQFYSAAAAAAARWAHTNSSSSGGGRRTQRQWRAGLPRATATAAGHSVAVVTEGSGGGAQSTNE
eukprot:COSAG01_NODE_16195_length_1261_cov_1.176420_2_plen_85_part_01